MVFNNMTAITDEEQEREHAHHEWLREVAGIPKPLRLLLNRRDIYGISQMAAETLEQSDKLKVLVDSCMTLRSSGADAVYRSVEDLSAERLNLAEALQTMDSSVCKELSLCWRMAAGTSLTPTKLRQELGQEVVQLFGAYSSNGPIGWIGLGTACDLALAVASWSVVCHGGSVAIGGQTTGPWLLFQTRITSRFLRDAGENHPGSYLREINAGLQAEVEFLRDQAVTDPVDNSYSSENDRNTRGRQTASKRARTLH